MILPRLAPSPPLDLPIGAIRGYNATVFPTDSPAPGGQGDALQLHIPCSTSNLGPGFDCLGLALDLWLEVHARPCRGAPPGASFIGQGGGEAAHWPTGPDNLLLKAFQLARQTHGEESRSVVYEFNVSSAIPVARGLGSSGAAVAAGLLAASMLQDRPPSLGELVRMGIELEGHPDNVCASLMGGLTLCHPHAGAGGSPLFFGSEVHADVGVALAWPATGLSTQAARRVLPSRVDFEQALENPRRLALLLEGLRSGRPELIAAGMQDHLHEEHRRRLIPRADAAVGAALAEGAWGACLSGSGSALVALCPLSKRESIAGAMALALGGEEAGAKGLATRIVSAGQLGLAQPWR